MVLENLFDLISFGHRVVARCDGLRRFFWIASSCYAGLAMTMLLNKSLGQRLLRDVLKLKQGELLTIEMLEQYGIDSVRIDKIDAENYEINFAPIYSYDDFMKQFLIN